MTRVRIDASSPVVEAGLRTLLEEKFGFQTAKSGEIADVLLSDRQFDEIENQPPPLPVVLLTDQSVSSMVRQGARGVLPPNATPLEIRADRKSTRLNSSHPRLSRMPSSA